MANQKEYSMLYNLNAEINSSFRSTFGTAQKTITEMQNELQALNKIQADISAYQKQQGAIEASKKKLQVLQQQYDNLQREQQETGDTSAATANKLLAQELQIQKTSISIDNQTVKLNHLGEAMKAAGVNTEDLTGESARLGKQIEAVRERQEAAADEAANFGAQASSAFGAVGQAIAAAGIAVALKEIVEMYTEAVEASMEFESAMTGVAKTTDMSDAELAAMAKEIKELSTDIPIVTEELAGIGEVAGQLGISKANLMDFSETMAMLATATTMTAEEGATMLAQLANITQMNPAYYSNLASTIVALGNSYATTEQKITDMSQGIAASASLAGMSEADMVALSAAVTSLGIETQAGSTSMSKLISELMTAVETGDNLNEFARIANMSAAEFSDAWGDNAVDALQAFVMGLSDTERNGKSATVALTELGITETRMQRMILSLSNSGDLLNRTLETSTQAWAENTALTDEAQKRYATTQSQLTMMQNSYNNLRIAIGDDFTPTLRELYSVATDVLGNMTDFVEENPELVKAVTAFIGVFGTATVGLTAYAAATKIATAVTGAFTTAAGVSLLGPIMAVVGGVAALTAVIVALAGATKDETENVRELSAASREQYYQMIDLEDEYNEVVDAMGETSYEAQILKRKLDDATEAFEENKQTAEELASAHKEVIDAHNELMDSYGETISSVEKEARSNETLIKKLENLMLVEGKSAEAKQEILAVVEMLNEAMPELGLAYDQYADSLNMSADAIHAVIEAEIAREKNAANYEKLKELISEEGALYDNLQTNIRETAAAEEELAAAQAAATEMRKELGNVSGEAGGRAYAQELMPYVLAVGYATDAVNEATEAEREAQEAYDENQAVIKELTAALAGYAEETGTAGDISNNLTGKIRDISERMAELTTAYEEAYAAAHESVSGQYSLWDEAAEVVATSAKTINQALESQADYWKNYNTNLANLSERTTDIEGLSELIASFADGSEGSVNAIAGMASATDEELAAMVTNWKALQSEQETVASSLANIETEFSETMANLQLELETSIAEMDLGEEAAESGKSTIQGFINGAQDMLPALQRAYTQIAQAAVDAIDEKLDIHSPSKVLELRGRYVMAGFEEGITAKEHDIMTAMSGVAAAGADALTTEAVSANVVSDRYSDGPSPVFHIKYDFTGASVGNVPELRSMLMSRDEELKEYILDVIDDRDRDKARRAYA